MVEVLAVSMVGGTICSLVEPPRTDSP